MKALVAYDSQYGNTEVIARAIAAGLRTTDEVNLAPVEATHFEESRWQLVVVGAPTQRHAVSRPIARLLQQLAGLAGVPVATFDTRFRMPRLLSGAASVVIANQMRAGGATLLTEPQSFFVRGREGPLEPGEEERARDWGVAVRQIFDRRGAALSRPAH